MLTSTGNEPWIARLSGAGTSVSTQNPNFTAYTLDYQADHSRSVVLNNKHATQGVQVTVARYLKYFASGNCCA